MIRENFKFQISDFKFKGKKVLVVGLARSGTGAANLLSTIGAEVQVTDVRPMNFLKDNIKRLLPSINVVAGEHPGEIFNTSELIVVSPGVPLNIPPIVKARAKGIPIIGELELAYQVIQSEVRQQTTDHRTQTLDSKLATPAFIGVTGTNGKSTVTTLIDMMLKKANFKTIFAGNIGNALTEEIRKALGVRGQGINDSSPHASRLTPIDYIVTEVSSFQLESIQDFKLFVAVLLNITPDHFDRYSSMQEYVDAKVGIFKNQGNDDYLILNADDPLIMKMYNAQCTMQNAKLPKALFFSRKREVEGIYYKDGSLHCKFLSTPRAAPFPLFGNGAVSSRLELIAANEVRIKGAHNLENAMAASLAAIISGCPIDSVRNVLKDFSGLEHRLEFVQEINGVTFINDSKGTNVGAVARALESYQNIVLIMGGRDKEGDFTVLKNLIKEKVKTIILLGEAKEKIAKALGEVTKTILVNSLTGAVEVSVSEASDGDVVLLCPGCTSFDMFVDFEERGRKFKEAVNKIQKSKFKNPNCETIFNQDYGRKINFNK